MQNSILLTICIPIYNRQPFLERHLARLNEDHDLFDSKVQLIVSDNCSTDDLFSCCRKYQSMGLNFQYHRNETNIGADGNFEWCFHHADGKYVWLLGSDDILVEGTLRKIINVLENGDYGLIHLSMKKKIKEFTVFYSSDEMAINVNYWITFLSANIIRTDSLETVNLSKYRQSFMIQVPAYLNACCSYPYNAILYMPFFFESGNDSVNNGGYNLFEVFVTNLFSIYQDFVDRALLSKQAFRKIMRIEYRDFLCKYIVSDLILHNRHSFSVDGGWRHLACYFAFKPYAYIDIAKVALSKIIRWRSQ